MKAIIVIGTSGAGKTALCHSLASIYRSIFGDGSVMTINLDSANEDAENHFDVTITELIQLEEIMEEYNIG